MKITTRLILSFLIVSIIPLALMSYIGRRAMDQIGSLAMDESTETLKELGEASIRQQALGVARQIELYLQAHPESLSSLLSASVETSKADETLSKIAVQPVGETGYTAVYDDKGITHLHINADLVGSDMHDLADSLPDFWTIFETSLDGTESSGYYAWQDADGTIRDKYMSCVPVGNTPLRVAATTYIDEFYRPIHVTETEIADITRLTRFYMQITFIVLLVTSVLVAILMATITIRPLNRIAEGARLFSQGKLDHQIPNSHKDEIGQLATTFNQMARDLQETIHEKELAVQQLNNLNQRLEHAVKERTKEIEIVNRDLASRQRELLTLQEVSQHISSLLSLDQVLHQVVSSLVNSLGYQAVAFFLVDEETNQVYLATQAGLSDGFLKQGRLKIGQEGITGYVAASGEPLLVADVTTDPRYIAGAEGIRSGVYVPLVIGRRVCGVLNVESTRYNAFDTHDLEMIIALANQAAIVIDNARLFQSVQEQAEKLSHMAQNLTKEKQRLDAILKNIADGLIVTAPDNTILLVNPAFKEMFGLPDIALVGHTLGSSLAVDAPQLTRSQGELQNLIAQALNEPSSTFVADIHPADKRTLLATSAAIRDGEAASIQSTAPASATSVVTVLRDVTYERAVDQMKTDLISTVSHELRTPLTSVLGFTKLIQRAFDKDITDKIAADDRRGQRAIRRIGDNLDIIVSEGERLTRLINDVLDIAKMEAGKLEWHMADIHISEIIHEAVSATASLADAKGLQVKVKTAPDVPLVYADQDRLIQVMTNLLSNAIKFTDRGEICIKSLCATIQPAETAYDAFDRFSLRPAGDHSSSDVWLAVSVQDTGIGIAEKDLSQVFEKFKQVGDILTERPKGTGLGLSICKEIVEHHGGHIWVESTPGVGSTFTFALPAQTIEKPKPPVLGEIRRRVIETLPFESKGQRILVVDDEKNIRKLLRQELTEAGYQVIEAANGTEALSKARAAGSERPDLITLDVMMPDINGFDVISVLKADPATADIPVLVLSILEDKKKGLRLGANEYLTKPLDVQSLLQTIATLLARAEQGKGNKKVLVIDQDMSVIETVTQVLQERGYIVVEAYNGHDGLEKARQEKPDLIILDDMISQMNDHEVLKALKYETETRDAVVIVLATKDVHQKE